MTSPGRSVFRSSLALAAVLAVAGCEPAPTVPNPLAHLQGLHVVEFSAEWCGPCRMMAPALAQYEAESGVEVLKIDVDEQPPVASYFRVDSIPTILVLQDGEVVERHVGLLTLDQLKQRLPGGR